MMVSHFQLKTWLAGIAITVTVFFLAGIVRSEETKEKEGDYMSKYIGADAEKIGTDKCLMCHKDKAPVKDEKTHVVIFEGDKDSPQHGFACETCHGPGGKHNGNPAGILSFEKMPFDKVNEICTKCHVETGTFKAAVWKDGRHNKGELSCAKCHSGHSKYGKFILMETDVKLCATCHADEGAAFEKGEHGKNDAGLTCSKCHNPHN